MTTPKYSIVTTCKGRLHNLKRTLPAFLGQPNTEVIVVDYDCPDGTAAYVAEVHPAARLVSVTDQPGFNLPHARNLGAAQARGEFLVFLDADVVVSEQFMAHIDGKLEPGSYALFSPTVQNSLRGSCVIARKHFTALGGYDELLAGYESEDLDMYMRLGLLGARKVFLDPAVVVEVIEQDLAERTRFRGDSDLKRPFLRGQLYMSAKEMVMRADGTAVLGLPLRRKIYEEVNRNLESLYSGTKDFSLEVSLPDKYKRGLLQEWEFSRAIVVKARKKKPL